MGRLAAALNVDERLRPWAEAGVSHLLVGEHARDIRAARTRQGKPAPQRRPQAGPPPRPAQAPPAPKTRPLPKPAKPLESKPPAPEPQQESTGLPPAWEKILHGVPQSAKLLFTYFELGQDMGGQPDPMRRELLTTIIHLMRQPKGVIGFWPHTELADGQIITQSDYFWRGIELRRIRRVAVFGRHSLEAVAPEADPNLVIHEKNGVHLLALPSTEELKSSPFEQVIRAIDPLRSFLHGLD